MNNALSVTQKQWLQERGIPQETWSAMCNSLFPGAQAASVAMYHDYCVARKLDPLKKPAHIVGMMVENPQTRQREWRDVIMPGIYEYRTTASRTGQYVGQDEIEYGNMVEMNFGGKAYEVPEWAKATVYRLVQGVRAPFSEKVFFDEVCATKKNGELNAMWTKRKRGQLGKCAEAAALRKAFPDELGGEQTIEEMEGRTINGAIDVTPQKDEQIKAADSAIEGLEEPPAHVVEVLPMAEAEPVHAPEAEAKKVDVALASVITAIKEAATQPDLRAAMNGASLLKLSEEDSNTLRTMHLQKAEELESK